MDKLPHVLRSTWENREGPIVFATTDKSGNPNVIYVTTVKMSKEGNIVIADNFFQKTRANIFAGSRGAVLYITKEGKSYQLKGTIEYLKDGGIYKDIRQWADPQYPRVAAALLKVEEAYSGSEKIL